MLNKKKQEKSFCSSQRVLWFVRILETLWTKDNTWWLLVFIYVTHDYSSLLMESRTNSGDKNDDTCERKRNLFCVFCDWDDGSGWGWGKKIPKILFENSPNERLRWRGQKNHQLSTRHTHNEGRVSLLVYWWIWSLATIATHLETKTFHHHNRIFPPNRSIKQYFH